MNIYDLIINFKYIAIFIGSFIEGPTVGLIVGFLARVHYIHLTIGYLAHVSGDWLADMMYYTIGYFGGAAIVPKMAKIFKFSVQEVEGLEESFKTHSKKLIMVGKITHVIGFPILIAAGVIRYSWRDFLFLDLVATFIKGAILVFIGFYFGGLWEKVNNVLLVAGGIGLLIIITQVSFILIRRFLKIKNGDIMLDSKEEERWRKKWRKK